ncbi:MAG: FecR domain-containing protein, partial [Methylovulum sp.]|nr:FecR domain-containing protein [Methylovulum sp.]
KVVGKVSFARGSNAAQQPGTTPRLLGQDAEIFLGDNIQTTERSFVIITFNDGAKVTVRPNSSFSVDQYEGQQTAHPQAQLSLHEGAIEADTGAIAKQAPDSFRIKTPLATVKAQEARYSVKICGEGCQQESKAAQTAQEQAEQAIVARIVDIKGHVNAKSLQKSGAPERPLTLGAPLYNTDHLHSQANSYALMVFRDGEKITLQPSSEMAIADYSYQRPGQPDHALFRLAVGGLRALTGSIGKTNKSAYAIDTPVGTIGIRGTGFDLTCVGSCVNDLTVYPDELQAGRAEGLYSHVWQGQIVFKNSQGEYLLAVPENAYLASDHAELWKLPQLPVTLPDTITPRPDKDRHTPDKVFMKQPLQTALAGVYVSVHEGQANVGEKTGKADVHYVNVAKNGMAYVSPQYHIALLTEQPLFQADELLLVEAGLPSQDTTNVDMTVDGCDQ